MGSQEKLNCCCVPELQCQSGFSVTGVFQVLNYDDFISKPLSSSRLAQQNLCSNGASSAVNSDHQSEHDVQTDILSADAQIAILSTGITGIGPQQCDVLQVQSCTLSKQTSLDTCAVYSLFSLASCKYYCHAFK
jgi:hypothetical protein